MASQVNIASRPSLGAAVQLLAAAQLPTEDLTAAHCEHFFFAGSPTKPTVLVGLERLGNVALLRGSSRLLPYAPAENSQTSARQLRLS